MPTPTYTALANITLGSSASSVSFSSIPASFRDLVLVVAGTNTASGHLNIRYNGDTGSNYSRVVMEANAPNGARSFSATESALFVFVMTTTQGNLVHQVMDYSATDKHKTSLSRENRSSDQVSATAGRWANTAAITSMTATVDANQMATGTTLSLYGIAS